MADIDLPQNQGVFKERKHTPITSEAQRVLFGAELARNRAGKKTRTGMSEEDLVSHLHESKGKSLPARASKMEKARIGHGNYKCENCGKKMNSRENRAAATTGDRRCHPCKVSSKMEKQLNKCPQCGVDIEGEDHPKKHHPLCAIARLAKKNPDGSFAKRREESSYHESTIPNPPRGRPSEGYGRLGLSKAINDFIIKRKHAFSSGNAFMIATRNAKNMGYKDFSFGSEGRAVRDKMAQEIGKKHGVKIKTTWKMEKSPRYRVFSKPVGRGANRQPEHLTTLEAVNTKEAEKMARQYCREQGRRLGSIFPERKMENCSDGKMIKANPHSWEGMKDIGMGKCEMCGKKDNLKQHLNMKLCRPCVRGVARGFESKSLSAKINHLCKSIEYIMKKEPKLGSGERFKRLTNKLEGKPGVYDPKGLAAAIGRKKYGKKKFQGLAAAAGKRG